MKLKYECLPCLINQVVKVADITNADNREILFKKVFTQLAEIDLAKSNPEIIGIIFQLLKEHIGNEDPYKEIRAYYNKLFLDLLDNFEHRIDSSLNPFRQAVKYAIIGNIIDFNPIHNSCMEDIMRWFEDDNKIDLTIDHSDILKKDIKQSKKLLYLGDNCGEICLDKLLIKQIKACNPDIDIYFGVRGKSVINDSIEADAYFVGINEYANIISNGDGSLGTVLHRTNDEFKDIYQKADIIIAKGQANYECLSEDRTQNIYFMLVSKCAVIAKDIGVDIQSFICMNNSN